MIEHSRQESERLGLRVFRADAKKSDELTGLTDVLMNESPDVVRLRIDSACTDVFDLLNRMNIPWFLHYISVRLEMKLHPGMTRPKPLTNMVFHPYTLQQRELMHRMAYETMKDTEGYYFKHRVYDTLIPGGTLFRGHADYATEFTPEIHPDRFGFLGSMDGEWMSFFNVRMSGKTAVAEQGGVLPAYRAQGAAMDGYQIITHDYLLPRGAEVFAADVQVQNLSSLRGAMRHGLALLPAGSHLRINLLPLLSHTEREPRRLPTDGFAWNPEALLELPEGHNWQTTAWRWPAGLPAANGVELRWPVWRQQAKAVVARYLAKNGRCVATRGQWAIAPGHDAAPETPA